MKKVLLATAAVLGITPALAADLSIPAPVFKAPAVAVYPWQNCYAALEAGGLTGSQQTGSPTAGGMVGCNFQTGALVYGFEGSVDAAKASQAPAPGTVDVKALGNVSARLGYAYHPAVPLAFGPVTISDALIYAKAAVPMKFIDPSSAVETGYGFAGGIEFPVRPYMTIGYEYRFNHIQVNDHGFFTVWRIYYAGL